MLTFLVIQSLEIDEILALMPHRAPFVFLDKVIELIPGQRALGLKNLAYNEPFFVGHFPSYPVMPGVLIIEAMAQLSGILAAKSTDGQLEKLMYLVGVSEAKFRRRVRPGDTMMLESSIANKKGNLWKFKVKATVDNKAAAEAIISTMSAS